MNIDEKDYLAHYGILRRSGRYPWGSGGSVPERSKGFLDHVAELRRQGLTDLEIAKGMALYTDDGKPWTSTDFRTASSIARNEKRAADQALVQRLRDKGMSNVAIEKQTGIPESQVRALLAPGVKDRIDVLAATTGKLRELVGDSNLIDVGSGNEHYLGVSEGKLKTAVKVLRDEGYTFHYLKVEQLGTGKMTTHKVLGPPGMTSKEAYRRRHEIKQCVGKGYSEDGGRSYLGVYDPVSISSKRIGIRYAEDGGAHEDGMIYIRPGVHDLDMGANRYAQVRIAVDGTHYLKGMAMYRDDLPKGVDVLFNTPKSKVGIKSKLDVMKPIKDDPENPFGSIIRQITATDVHGNTRAVSALNIVGSPSKEGSGAEGSWGTWSKNLSAQFLSKQSPQLAKSQLDVTYETQKIRFNEIMKLTNPTVRKKLLEDLAEDVDSSAVHMKAAQMYRQASQVILPLSSIKPTEIYAPQFKHGERVVLVRYPHAGTFEIPELVVNNRHPEGRKLLGDSKDAVGIHHKVAEKLSGADFDGDSVVVIPNNAGRVKSTATLEGLRNFDTKREYPPYDGMKTIDGGTYNAKLGEVIYGPRGKTNGMQQHMGEVSNLITDMTIKKASTDELARAVRHSMVVIDAEKHHLNYKESARANGIPALKEKYQGTKRGGASTLISRKKKTTDVPERKQGFIVDRSTGQKVFRETGRTTIDKHGNTIPKTEKVKLLSVVDDAHKLSSGTPIEKIYADHSNRLKSLGNDIRKEAVNTRGMERSPSAARVFAPQVKSLTAKLEIAERNRPLERQAQVLANAQLSLRKQANPDMTYAEEKKVRSQLLAEARTRTGAKSQSIHIDDDEWKAIQSGAVSNHHLSEILRKADMDRVKDLATPKRAVLMTNAKTARAQQMLEAGYTQADVAAALGVSLTTLKTTLSEGG